MRKASFCIVLLIIFFLSNAQKMPSDYFEEAEAFFKKEQYAKAIVGYEYIVNNHPRNSIYQNALNNLAYAYWSSGDTSAAMSLFQTILAGNFNDRKPVIADIMASPFANYKHYASMSLYEINNDLHRYDSALYYLNLANTGNPYEHFCGNAQDSKSIYMALTYAELFEQLKDSVNAEKALLDAVFLESEGNGDVLEKLKVIYQKKGLKDLDKTFDFAVDSIKVMTDPQYPGSVQYILSFRNNKLVIPVGFYGFLEQETKEEIQAKLRATMFRFTLASLNQVLDARVADK